MRASVRACVRVRVCPCCFRSAYSTKCSARSGPGSHNSSLQSYGGEVVVCGKVWYSVTFLNLSVSGYLRRRQRAPPRVARVGKAARVVNTTLPRHFRADPSILVPFGRFRHFGDQPVQFCIRSAGLARLSHQQTPCRAHGGYVVRSSAVFLRRKATGTISNTMRF